MLTTDVGHELADGDGAEPERLVGPVQHRQLEQVGDERGGALGLAAGRGDGLGHVVGPALAGEPLGLVERDAERGQRRPQVVADVGDQLAAQAVGVAERLDRALDAGRHLVDGARQPAQLVGPGVGQAVGVVALAQALDTARDLADRPEQAGREQGAQQQRQRDRHGDRDGRRLPERAGGPAPLLNHRLAQGQDQQRTGGQPVGRQDRGEPPAPAGRVEVDGDAAGVERVERGPGHVGPRRVAERLDGSAGLVDERERVREPRPKIGPEPVADLDVAERPDLGPGLDLLGDGVEAEPQRAREQLGAPVLGEHAAQHDRQQRRRHLGADQHAGDFPKGGPLHGQWRVGDGQWRTDGG